MATLAPDKKPSLIQVWDFYNITERGDVWDTAVIGRFPNDNGQMVDAKIAPLGEFFSEPVITVVDSASDERYPKDRRSYNTESLAWVNPVGSGCFELVSVDHTLTPTTAIRPTIVKRKKKIVEQNL